MLGEPLDLMSSDFQQEVTLNQDRGPGHCGGCRLAEMSSEGLARHILVASDDKSNVCTYMRCICLQA